MGDVSVESVDVGQRDLVVANTPSWFPKVQVRLSTLLILFLLTACVSFWFAANQRRIAELDRLLWLETSTGKPAVVDPTQMQVLPYKSQPSGKWKWSLWVPYEEKAELSLFTEDLDAQNPDTTYKVVLQHGRHDISLEHQDRVTIIAINDRECFRREKTAVWNLSPPWKSCTTTATVLDDLGLCLIDAYGFVRLKFDEPYDSKKHRIGLRILIKPIRPWQLF